MEIILTILGYILLFFLLIGIGGFLFVNYTANKIRKRAAKMLNNKIGKK